MTKTSRLLAIAAAAAFYCAQDVAVAACSGSAGAYTCTAGSTAAQITSAIGSVGDEGVVTLANGTYNLTSVISLNGRNGVTLKCETVRGCTLSRSGDQISIDYIPSTRTNLIRVSGFIFTGAPGTAKVWFYGANTLEKVRIDHNTFDNLGDSNIAILIGETSSAGNVYGVIDNNIFQGTTSFMGIKSLSGGSTWQTGLQGGSQNLFIEDNEFEFSDYANLGSGGIDAWQAGGIVVRYNSLTNVRIVNHSLCHNGPANSEIYNNTINAPDSAAPQYRNIHWQGSGETLAFGNTIYGGHMALQHYRSDASQMPQGSCTASTVCDGSEGSDGNRSTWNGYPCWHQPGRNNAGTLRPVYLWGNLTNTGTRVDVSIESGSPGGACGTGDDLIDCHLRADRDYFQAVSASAQTSPTSPFNGTTGVGFGTLANRPTTCSVGGTMSEDAGLGGVGYFATDTNTLYRCSATNTWTAHYTPYTYPHPLQESLLFPPTNLRAIRR